MEKNISVLANQDTGGHGLFFSLKQMMSSTLKSFGLCTQTLTDQH